MIQTDCVKFEYKARDRASNTIWLSVHTAEVWDKAKEEVLQVTWNTVGYTIWDNVRDSIDMNGYD